jgi:hypothetical protein
MNELLNLKVKWVDHLQKSIELNAPNGEVEMIKWFINDINQSIENLK